MGSRGLHENDNRRFSIRDVSDSHEAVVPTMFAKELFFHFKRLFQDCLFKMCFRSTIFRCNRSWFGLVLKVCLFHGCGIQRDEVCTPFGL